MARVSTVQEDKMKLEDMSWKEVVEFYGEEMAKDMPEMLWVDPAEQDFPEDV
jgi:hypothetical protein